MVFSRRRWRSYILAQKETTAPLKRPLDPETRPFVNSSSSLHDLARKAALVCAIAAAAALVVVRFDDVMRMLGLLAEVLTPFLAGFALAYLVNLIMSLIERIYFPHAKHPAIIRSRRPVCLILAIAVIAAVIAAVVALLASEIRDAFGAVGQGAAAALQTLAHLVEDDPQLSALLQGDPEEWIATAQKALASIGGAGSAASTAVRWGGNVAHALLNAVIAIIFAVYVLVGKERIIESARSMAQTVLPQRAFDKLAHVVYVADDSFTRFISGQCLEACILGVLCALGMTLLGFPYAGSIGLCVGITSLVPFIGAWIGGIVGAFIIASVSIKSALLFVVFLVVLQQIEGHLIYPNVVGSSVGMPGIWTFFAVVAGGALFGVLGVLLGVPVVSTVRTLVLEWKSAREASLAQPACTEAQPSCAAGEEASSAKAAAKTPHDTSPQRADQDDAKEQPCKAAPAQPDKPQAE